MHTHTRTHTHMCGRTQRGDDWGRGAAPTSVTSPDKTGFTKEPCADPHVRAVHCRVQVRKQLRKVTHGDRLPGRWSLPGVGLGQVVCVRVDQVDGEQPRPCGACRALQDSILVNTLQRPRLGPCRHPEALVLGGRPARRSWGSHGHTSLCPLSGCTYHDH